MHPDSDAPDTPDDADDGFARLISYLPARIWYLSTTGLDMWCRNPYSFLFSTSDAAGAFAAAMDTGLELVPVGIDSREVVSDPGLEALRAQNITRVFLDPQIDPSTGDVFGRILRLEALD